MNIYPNRQKSPSSSCLGIEVHLTEEPIDVVAMMHKVQNDAHGAIDLFVGTVRNHHNGKPVTGITYDAHSAMAEKVFHDICAEGLQLWPGTQYAIAHFKGELPVGGISIVIAVSAAHRAESFEACRYVIEQLKMRAPIWKQEHYQDGKSDWLPGHSLRPAVLGIVLAGGRSSRMGQNKALLDFKGKPLVQHMMDILRQAGVAEVCVSGSLEGYPYIADDQPYAGPARAIQNIMRQKPGYQGYLCVPVDMPFLSIEALKHLLNLKGGGYFRDWPLPVYITPPFIQDDQSSVQGFLAAQGIAPVDLPHQFEGGMKNINTLQAWKEIMQL